MIRRTILNSAIASSSMAIVCICIPVLISSCNRYGDSRSQEYDRLLEIADKVSYTWTNNAHSYNSKRDFLDDCKDETQGVQELLTYYKPSSNIYFEDLSPGSTSYFVPLIRLISLQSDVFEEEENYTKACLWDILLMKMGLLINKGGHDGDCNTNRICFSKASLRIYRMIGLLSSEEQNYLLEALQDLLSLMANDNTAEHIQNRIVNKEPVYTEQYFNFSLLSFGYCKTLIAICCIRIAIEEYVHKTGSLPETLEDCLHESIKMQLTKDVPWKIVYNKTDSDYTIYSYGPDNTDDQGYSQPLEVLAMGRKGDIVMPVE